MERPGAYEVCIGDLVVPVPVAEDASVDAKRKYEEAVQKYEKGNRMARGIFARTLDSSICDLVIMCKTSREIWIKLHKIFERIDRQTQYSTQAEFINFNRDPSDSIAGHIAKLEKLVSRMSDLSIKPNEFVIICKLLDTLPEDYEPLKQAWSARTEESQTLTQLQELLISEENRRKIRASNGESESLLVNKTKPSKNKNQEDWKTKIKCFHCGKRGHYKKNCRQLNKKFNREDGKKENALTVSESYLTGSDESWIIDSGATQHLSHRMDWFSTFQSLKVPLVIKVGNNTSMKAMGYGNISIDTYVNEKWIPCVLKDELYVPEASRNLLSVSQAVDRGVRLNMLKNTCQFVSSNGVIAQGKRCGNLYKLIARVVPKRNQEKEMYLCEEDELQLWHERLVHQNKKHVKKILDTHGVKLSKPNKDLCEGCVYGKFHRNKFNNRTSRASEVLETVHADICGPFEETSMGGARYFLCFTDDYSRFRQVYFLKYKNEAAVALRNFIKFNKNQKSQNIKSLLTDGGLEFDNQIFKGILTKYGIQFRMTCPYTPQQGGCAERTNRTVVELARSILTSKVLPKVLWAEVVNSVVYVLNHTGPTAIDGKTPYELFYGKKPRINHLRVIGTKCYTNIPKQKRQKWDAKGKKGVLVGYLEDVDGYRIWLPGTNKIERTRDVAFCPEITTCIVASVPAINTNDEACDKNRNKQKNGNEDEANQEVQEKETRQENQELQEKEARQLNQEIEEQETRQESREIQEKDTRRVNQETQEKETGNGNKTPYFLRPRSKSKTKNLECLISEEKEPETYQEAINSNNSEKWKEAIEDEMKSLKEHGVWKLELLPEDRQPLQNKWVFSIKNFPNGRISKYKARLVVKGFNQEKNVDFFETFSPVIRLDTIRTILSVATAKNLELVQFDVKTAFLYGSLEEEIYMVQPEGYDDGSGRVCRLIKSLYGLKQAPRCWHTKFEDSLLKFGLKKSTADPCLFLQKENNEELILGLYVDDGLLAATPGIKDKFLRKLEKEFQITFEIATNFLNIQIRRLINGNIFISQELYARKILKRFNMEEANPVNTPMKRSIGTWEDGKNMNLFPFREAIGSLMYLSIGTRPDITIPTSYLSQYLENNGKCHWMMVKRIFRYLKGTITYGLLYNGGETGNLECYCDADYATDVKTRKSVSGMIFKYSGGPITWSSKRQRVVTLSTTEAEYVAACEATKEIIWLKEIFKELSPLQKLPILQVDNASAIKLAKNEEFHPRSKHIDVRYHFIREKLKNKEFDIQHVSSNNQLADILTKALTKPRFNDLRYRIGMVDGLTL